VDVPAAGDVVLDCTVVNTCGTATVALTAFTFLSDNVGTMGLSGQLDETRADTLYVGAALDVDDDAIEGDYSGTYDVTVAYE
jgi:hypothetical protein